MDFSKYPCIFVALFLVLLFYATNVESSSEHFFKGELFFDQNHNNVEKEHDSVQTLWHIQKLNHFNPADITTWKQVFLCT